jgi:hypothetical protein
LLGHYGQLLSKHGQSHIIKEIKDRDIKLIDSTTIGLCLSIWFKNELYRRISTPD